MNNSTIIGQLLQMFPRFEFQKAVQSAGTEYHARGFSSWNHFTAMLFGQLADRTVFEVLRLVWLLRHPPLSSWY